MSNPLSAHLPMPHCSAGRQQHRRKPVEMEAMNNSSAPMGSLTPHAHELNRLAAATALSVSSTPPKILKKLEWKLWHSKFRLQIDTQIDTFDFFNPSNDTIQASLRKARDILVDIFFSGKQKLKDIPLFVDKDLNTSANLPQGQIALGRTDFDPNTKHISIILDPSTIRDSKEYIGSLLHELCHAWLRKFSCSRMYCNDTDCRRDFGWFYRFPHCGAWAVIAMQIEGKSEKYLGVKLDLVIEHSIELERRQAAVSRRQ